MFPQRAAASNNNVAGDQNKDSTSTIDSSSKNDGVIASKDVLKCSSSVNKTGSVKKTSVNKSNEASAMEGTTIPVVGAEVNHVENGAVVAVSTVPLPPSESPGSLPSGRPVSTLWKVWRRSDSTLGRRCFRGALISN